jgi:hypothetical protein
VEKILLGRAPMTGGERRFGSRFGLLGQLQPGALPGVFVAGFDALHSAGDVEDIAAALLRLSDQAQSMAAERMVREKEIEHGRLRAALTEKDYFRSRSKTFLALAIKCAGFADRSLRLTVVATACRLFSSAPSNRSLRPRRRDLTQLRGLKAETGHSNKKTLKSRLNTFARDAFSLSQATLTLKAGLL